ncbi:MAG: hypothetical protein M3Q56_08930 [Bacteroidota bacterium]|nr:hypothetical protein [Bacteroidota bacterium]
MTTTKTLFYYLVSNSFFCLLILLVSFNKLSAQTKTTSDTVKVIHADLLRFERFNGKEYQFLSKDVLVQHKKVYLLCDSAVIEGNKVLAIGHVRIVEGDSLQIFGDTLKYNGDKQMADFIGNVVLNHREQQLFTNTLHYDLKKRIASYYSSALLMAGTARLKSKRGYYHAKNEQSFFKDSVIVLLDSGMSLLADSLVYEAKGQRVRFTGPTLIKQDNLEIYTEAGYHDIPNKFSYFAKYPRYRKGSQYADAEKIYYDDKNGIINLKTNAWIRDSVKEARGDSIYINEKTDWVYIIGNGEYKEGNRILKGDRISFNRKSESLQVMGRTEVKEDSRITVANTLNYDGAKDIGIAIGNVISSDTISGFTLHTDTLIYNKRNKRFHALGPRPYISTPFNSDTLYLAADSLYTEQIIDKTDSFLVLRAFKNVKIWSKKLQAVCDSLYYHGKDSAFQLFYNPVMWSDTSQFTGDTIQIYMANKALKEVHLNQNGFIINESTATLDNQIKGRTITAYFIDKKMNHVDVLGNSESVYFIQDDEKSYIGTNFIQCSRMKIRFNENEQIDKIDFYTKPEGNMLPLSDGKLKFLDGYLPRKEEKPLSFLDILK